MGKTPINFKRVAAAFDMVAARRPCDSSSGSEYSPESSARDLSDLVNSFIENRDEISCDSEEINIDHNKECDDSEDDNYEIRKDLLQSLLVDDNDDDENKKGKIRDEIKELIAGYEIRSMSKGSRDEFKRGLTAHLRSKGYDAGLCKSRWAKTNRHPTGTYEYLDIHIEGTRFIIDVFLAREFDIARPTAAYVDLLESMPPIFIGRVEVLKGIVRLMSTAMKDSMKAVELHLPPWRRNGYMQAKWFGPHKRTTNPVPANTKLALEGNVSRSRQIGFDDANLMSYYCRDDFPAKNGVQVGLLAAAFAEK